MQGTSLCSCAMHGTGWARSPVCRERAHRPSLPAPTSGVTSPPHSDTFTPFSPHPRLRVRGRTARPALSLSRVRTRYWGTERTRVTAAPEPGQAVGAPASRGSPAPLPPLGGPGHAPTAAGTEALRDGAGEPLGSPSPPSPRKRGAGGTEGKRRRCEPEPPARLTPPPLPPGPPRILPCPLAPRRGGRGPI